MHVSYGYGHYAPHDGPGPIPVGPGPIVDGPLASVVPAGPGDALAKVIPGAEELGFAPI